jgi:hypothetical protein
MSEMSDLDKAIAELGEHMKNIVVNALTTDDVRIERTASLEFHPDEKKGIYGKGIYWKGTDKTKQLIYRNNPDRIFTTESIDLGHEQAYNIGNIPVLSSSELGSSVIKSYLTKVGTLQNLRTAGNLTVDDFIFFSSSNNRLGIGTEEPNGMLSLMSMDAEFIVEPEGKEVKVGTYTADDVSIVTDNTTRIQVKANGDISVGTKGNFDTNISVHGRIGVGYSTVDDDVSIVTAGPVRFQGKKQESRAELPRSGAYNKGDIVWNEDPKPTGYVGWICIRSGTPGEWKPFGQISS